MKKAATAANPKVGDIVSFTQVDNNGHKTVHTNRYVDKRTMSIDFIEFITNLKVNETKTYKLKGYRMLSYRVTLIEIVKAKKRWYTTILEKLLSAMTGKASRN